jgi:nitrogenase molybdenum-iron protein alpha/beta subunit
VGLTYQLADDIIRFVTIGDVGFADGQAVLRAAFAAAATAPVPGGWHLLFDIRSSAENRSAAELQAIADLFARARPSLSGRCAVVAADPLRFGVARMFGAFVESLGFTAMVVTRPPEAETWLRADARD